MCSWCDGSTGSVATMTVCETIRQFIGRGVIIRTVINNFTFDGVTTDPMQKAVRDALIGFMAATAQAQAEATKASQRAGIEHAKGCTDSPVIRRGKLTPVLPHLRMLPWRRSRC
jgi:DNA invertase Pin-like site-specific DNA recombinase